jgi:hypothetical protein
MGPSSEECGPALYQSTHFDRDPKVVRSNVSWARPAATLD